MSHVGDKIVERLVEQDSLKVAAGTQLSVVTCPVRITDAAIDQLRISVRTTKRKYLEGKIQQARVRISSLTNENELIAARAALKVLEGKFSGDLSDIDDFDVYVQFAVDVAGTSGVTPELTLVVASTDPEFVNNRHFFQVNGLTVAVERRNMNFLNGLTVDYHVLFDKQGFVLGHDKVHQVKNRGINSGI